MAFERDKVSSLGGHGGQYFIFEEKGFSVPFWLIVTWFGAVVTL